MTFTSYMTKAVRPLAAAALLGFMISPAAAADSADQSQAAAKNEDVLRICASAKEAPYSVDDETGFENKIAKIMADEMGREAEFVWIDKPAIYVVRDLLEKNKCDLVIGLDAGDPRVLTSTPYYRAPYVFVMREDTPLQITDFDSPDFSKTGNIGFDPGGPVETMLKKVGAYNRNFNYHRSLTNFKSRRNQYIRVEPTKFVSDVATRKADLAIVFAPEVARYVTENDAVKMVVVPDSNVRVDGEEVPFHFDQAMGVRKGDQELLDEVNAALERAKPRIIGVLEEEGIPVEEPKNKETTSKS
ncbi:methanol oxidation system protein MoxJ [Methyloligella sp. 2.7D]|uniref:methanol oxidation system protein MoxJ n=1 Tax=unclassified Methyloligella TaxID=2625955 RepID=UPI00157CBFCB|nr:methanol oxidation system protein MoxJ [Methyloligella sp. GL2]QKP78072.1 methanol oxidation system protein MoxJ [Methyloligella sp. GL2]